VRDGVWRVDVEVHRDPLTGARRRVSRTILGTREDAEIALSRLRIADHERRLPTGGTKVRSVKQAFQHYLQAVDGGTIELAPRTIVTSRSAMNTMSNTVLPNGSRFGDIRLGRLSWEDVEQCFAAMRATGRSPEWIRRCATVLSRALELARKRGLIDRNPCKDASRPRATRSRPYSPTAADLKAVLEFAQERDPEIGDVALLLASTGMRKGELQGLTWSDVDFEKMELHVAAAITDGGAGVGLVRKATKTSDWRDVPLTAAAVDALRSQADRREALTRTAPLPDDYVFAGSFDGAVPMRPEVLTNRWAAVRRGSPITLLHLRHFAATTMLDAGESYRTVATLLGNSEATLHLHYDGRTDVGKRKAIEALELGW
jgi:integrase